MQIIKPIKAVDVLTVEVVREVQKTTNALGVDLLLVGAQAKVIFLENIHGLNPGRATGDIDFAFAVESWAQFDQIKQSLIETGNFRALPKNAQRLLNHKMTNDVTAGYIITDVERLRAPMQKITDYILKCIGKKETPVILLPVSKVG